MALRGRFAHLKTADPRHAADLAAERDRLIWAHSRGLPTPAVLDWAAADDGARLVTAAMPGLPADQLAAADLAAAWPSIVAAVRALHRVPVADCPYRRDLDSMLAQARDVVGRDAVNCDFLSDEERSLPATVLLERVEREAGLRRRQERADAVVCHGDLTLANILVDGRRCAGFVDLGRLGVADVHADLALLVESARQEFPDLEQLVGSSLPAADRGRLVYHLRLDPLTW